MRAAGRLTTCKKNSVLPLFLGHDKIITILGRTYRYDGEMDEMGRAFGEGKATDSINGRRIIKGQFLRGNIHGICVWSRGDG